MSSTLVVLQANNLQHLNFLYQGSTRLKVVCFDLSPSLIILGANSGTIYVLDHETLHLKNQIPAGKGCVTQLSLSSDEQQVACALIDGIVMVFALQQAGAQLLTTSHEHQEKTVTSLVWAQSQSELYIGDASGRVSMLYVSKSKTASLFRSSCLHLMTLESSITQLDYREGYLLVSTLTRSYVCNTSLETFSQVGTKLRQGEYGGCFCQVNSSGTLSSFTESKEGVADLQASFTSSEKFGLSDCYEAVEEEQPYHRSFLGRERPGRSILPVLTSHVFCARPGTRIWEADHSGKVLATHQLKNALMVSPAEILLTDYTYQEQDLMEEISVLPPVTDTAENNLHNHESFRVNTSIKATHPPVSVSFTKMLSFYNKYLLATSAYGLYIIDPATTKVLLWVSVSDGISDIKVSGNSLIYKSGNGSIQNFMITTVDIAILILHTRRLYIECTSLCLKNHDAFVKSEFLSRLGINILKDLSNNITTKVIKERLNELKSFVISKRKINSNDIAKISGVTYVKNKSFEAEEIKANLNVALKNNPVLSNISVTRWNSEPHLSRNQVEWEKEPSTQDTLSLESNTMQEVKRNKDSDKSSICLHEAPSNASNEGALQLKSPEKSITTQSSPQRSSDTSGPDQDLRRNISLSSNPSCSQQVDPLSPQKSLESSLEMYEDPLFTPEESPSPDPEAASRILLDSHPHSGLTYSSHTFYNLAYAPIHPGSEAATLLQDLMESVTSNVMDTFTSGTKTITERLKSVAPLVTPWGNTEGGTTVPEVTRYHSNPDPKNPTTVTQSDIDAGGDLNSAIVIHSESKKKLPRRLPAFQDTKCSNQESQEESAPQPELPGVVRNLHELVCATLHQVTNTVDPQETQTLLSHWLEMFCHTVQHIQCSSKRSVPQGNDDQAGEGPVSFSSVDSSHSTGSADTSSDSLHWDSNDIGFEPLAVNTDIQEQITDLFLECLQAGVTTTKPHSWMVPQRVDLPQHLMTPPEVKKKDAFYAQIITSDCGLLQYSHLMNALGSIDHHNYILTWASLMEKITRERNALPSQPLPDIIPNLDFTRSQWVSFLHSIAASGSTKNLITIAAQMENPAVIHDVVFFLQYMVAHQVEMNSSLPKTQLPKLLLQYLTEFSHHKSLIKAYLNSWCLCSELQSDILRALLSVESCSHTHFSCRCGLPLPLIRPVILEDLADIILLHDIINPRGLADLCQSLGYWKGYCAINLAYCLQPSAQLFPYILQTGNLNLLDYFLELLHIDDFGMAFSTLVRISSGDINMMLCFICQTQIPFHRNKYTNDSKIKFNHKDIVNGDQGFTESILSEYHDTDVTSVVVEKDKMITMVDAMEEVYVENLKQLWEIMVTKLLYRTSAANILRLLSTLEVDIPPGVVSEKVYMWCILASLADQRGPAARCAFLDSLSGVRSKPYSHKVFRALHHHPPKGVKIRHVGDTYWPSLSESVPEAVQNGSSPPPSLVSKEASNPAPILHHWGVWAEVLEGVCSCCHLRLPTPALVSEGGITVFSCSHAFHTICLSQHGYQCVRCVQSQPDTAAHEAPLSLTSSS